jgi:fructokinase
MIDIVAPHLPEMIAPGGLVYAPHGITMNVGGHAVNVAIDLAQLGVDNVAAAGCIGDDILGEFIVDTLKTSGVDPRPEKTREVGTAKNIALTVEGEDRRFIAELAANTLLSPSHLIKLLCEHPRILYIGTIGGLQNVDTHLQEILRQAHELGSTNIVDVIPPTESDWKHLIKALPDIDILHLNDDESRLVTEFGDPLLAAEALRAQGVKIVVVTCGCKGLVASYRNTIIKMPAFRVKESDSTGAGDALCAGIIHNLLSKQDFINLNLETILDALLEGQAAGAACVTEPGATTAVTRVNVDLLLRSQGEKISEGTSVTN